DPPDLPRPGGQEPLQGPEEIHALAAQEARREGRDGAQELGPSRSHPFHCGPNTSGVRGRRPRFRPQASTPSAVSRVLPPSHGTSASGIVTEPSASWPFSRTAIRQRPTARPDPFSVWTNSGLPPPAGR